MLSLINFFSPIFILGLSLVLGVLGQYFFKVGAMKISFSSVPIWLMPLEPFVFFGLSVYLLSALLYVVSLKSIPLTVAYPSLACSYIAVLVVGHFFLGEAITLPKTLGIILICGGVLLIWK